MTFDLKAFKHNTKDFVSPSHFRVIVENDEPLTFLIQGIEITDTLATLSILEQEDFAVYDKICSWQNLYTLELKVELFNKTGELIKTLTGVCNSPRNHITHKTRFDWSIINDVIRWEVCIPVTWQPLE